MLLVKPLKNISETGREMVRLARAYRDDMAAYATASLPEVFALLKALPYRPDPEGVEFLQRPYYTLQGAGLGGDCDDKAICVGAYAALRGQRFRFVAVGRFREKPLHHVFAEVWTPEGWLSVDPTYSHHTLGQRPAYAKRVVIGGA